MLGSFQSEPHALGGEAAFALDMTNLSIYTCSLIEALTAQRRVRQSTSPPFGKKE